MHGTTVKNNGLSNFTNSDLYSIQTREHVLHTFMSHRCTICRMRRHKKSLACAWVCRCAGLHRCVVQYDFARSCRQILLNWTFIGPCIIIYFYNKNQPDVPFSQTYFILEQNSTCFGRSFRPSSGVQDCTYTRCCMYSLQLLMMDGKTVRNM